MDDEQKRRYRELAHQLRDRLMAGARDVELTGPDGTPWRVHRAADGGLHVDGPGGGVITNRLWPPSAERPADYPAEVPFLRDMSAFVGVASGPSRLVMVQWWQVPDAADVLARLIRETEDDGWVAVEPLARTTDAPGERCQFVRGSAKRIISRTGAVERDAILLLQAALSEEGTPV